MGRAVLLLVIAGFLIFSTTNHSLNQSWLRSVEDAAHYYSDQRARNIGNSIVNIMLARLSENTTLRYTTPQYIEFDDGEAYYRIEDTTLDGQQLVRISVDATYAGETRSITTFTDPAPVPSYFKYVALSQGVLTVTGANMIVQDDGNSSWNANMHTDGDITLGMSISPLLLKGFATYAGSVIGNWAGVTITPNQNPAGNELHSQQPVVSIPDLNAAAYQPYADEVHDSNYTLWGSQTLGSQSSPKIVYVGGKLFIDGSVSVSGYGVYVVRQDVELNGSLIPSPLDPNKSQVGIYTQGKFLMNDPTQTVHAQIFAQDAIVINGNDVNVHGSMTTKSTISFNGQGLRIYYKPAFLSLIRPIWPSEKRIARLFHLE